MVHEKDQKSLSSAVVFKGIGGLLFLYGHCVNLLGHHFFARHKIAMHL